MKAAHPTEELPKGLTNTDSEYGYYYKKYIPQCETLEGYEAPDFDPESYPQISDEIGKL